MIGDLVRMEIEDVAFGGDGVGRVSDLVFFVPFTVDGDEVEIEVTGIKKRHARGRVARLIVPSYHRVAPLCPQYERCGGCRMQHIAYTHQLELKRRHVAECFGRIAELSGLSVSPVIPSPLQYAYRGKAEFHLAGGRGKTSRTGFMARASNDLIEVENCLIVDESINRKYRLLRDRMPGSAVRGEGDRLVIWSDEPDEAPTEVAAERGRGPDIIRTVRGKRLTAPYRGFFQANLSLVGELVEQVMGMCALEGRETVIDAYGGVGLFSLFLGAGAARLYEIEWDRQAARCARMNLNRCGLTHAEVICGEVAAILETEFIRRCGKADVVVLDPPREGCSGETLAAVAALCPERIVYVSCNPATQARDCQRLSQYGYSLQRLQPLDMFPQTAHIEVVALLTGSATGKPRL